jgi:hypothetical protein
MAGPLSPWLILRIESVTGVHFTPTGYFRLRE